MEIKAINVRIETFPALIVHNTYSAGFHFRKHVLVSMASLNEFHLLQRYIEWKNIIFIIFLITHISWSAYRGRLHYYNMINSFTTFNSMKSHFINNIDHLCGTGGSMHACHAADPGSDPQSGQVFWVSFLRGFSSPVRQVSGNFRPTKVPEYNLAAIILI